jgi:hypothetical protein
MEILIVALLMMVIVKRRPYYHSALADTLATVVMEIGIAALVFMN